MKLSVILPARNEEKLIKSTIKDLLGHLKKKMYPFEILVVINGSNDRTEEIVKTIALREKRIIPLYSKAGYGFALRKGLKHARGSYVAFFNVDFYDLRLIDLIEIDLYGKDLIIGSKRTFWSEDKRPVPRRIISALFNSYLRLMHGFKGSDTHGIKIMKRGVVDKVFPKCKTTSGIFDTEFVIKAQRTGFRIADFPVSVKERRRPRFTNRLLETPADLWRLYRILNER